LGNDFNVIFQIQIQNDQMIISHVIFGLQELYIEEVPKGVTEADLLKEFPTAKKVKFQNGEG
jgi:hypothetical protein